MSHHDTLPVDRAPADTHWDQMTQSQKDQNFRDSIPHEEHLSDGYYMVGCVACDAEHAKEAAAGTCTHN